MRPAEALARRAFADARVRTYSFAGLFGVSALLQSTAYRSAYPDRADRIELARTIGSNSAVRVLYGEPHDLLTVGGYVGWRVGGSLAIFAAIWSLLGAIRAMRAEEDAGRADLVLAAAVSRRDAFLAQLAAIAAGAALIWLVTFAAFAAGRVPVGGAAYLALAIVSVVPVFAGVGAVASQLAPAKRVATALASGVLALALALRAIADTSSGLGGLRWATPLGWAEELRPFADPQPLALLPLLAAGAALLALAWALAARRDIGSGLLPARDSAPPRLALLGSPTAQAARSATGGLVAWLAGVGAFALLMGVLADTVSEGLSDDVRRQLEKLGSANVATPSGYLGFSFSFFLLVVSLYCCAQVGAARAEESDQRLETLLALPADRRRWLGGRLGLAAAGAALVALAAGVLAWAGAATQHAGVALADMLAAGANCLPAALLFLAVAALAFAFAPRAASAIAYGVVAAAYLWQAIGALLDVPGWLLALSPFHDVGLIPAESFKAGAAAIMLALAALGSAAAVARFRARDLAGG